MAGKKFDQDIRSTICTFLVLTKIKSHTFTLS